jgi:hypothetical protein
MRHFWLSLLLASVVVASACSSDRSLAPRSGKAGQLDFPSNMFAAYTRMNLPGTETVVALNDSGDVVGATATGGVLWHGATHERTTLPIIPTAIANDGTIAGSIDGHAATWKNGHTTVLDTATSIAKAICPCESSTVAGSVQVNGETHAAIWVDGIRIDAGVPPDSKHAEFSSIAMGFLVANAIVRTPDPRTGGFSDFPEAYSWSPAGGWLRIGAGGNLAVTTIASVNSHGKAIGTGFVFNIPETKAASYDLVAGTTVFDEGSYLPFFDGIVPTGINESQQVSETGDAVDPTTENSLGTVALVAGFGSGLGLVLPPGVIGDQAVGINSAGIIGGQSEGLPVLWTPNP